MIRAVVFDVGETLIDESREYGTWADWLGVPRHTFSAAFGAVIASGRDYREVFQVFRPGFDLAEERERRATAGKPEWFGEDDLYEDVRPTLKALKDLQVWVGIVGNQTSRAGGLLWDMGFPVDLIATSDDWGVQKPEPGFFTRLIEEVPFPADQVVYVGDRFENDIVPAQEVGMRTAFIQRGPWGWIHRDAVLPSGPDWRLTSLRELPELIVAS